MQDSIFLGIAGFTIRLVFRRPNMVSDRRKFLDFISGHFQPFLILSTPEHTDYTIYFEDSKAFPTVSRGKSTFMIFYSELDGKSLRTHYQISAYQLDMVLKHVISKLLAGKGFIVHASSALVKGKAQVFLGKSGAGKSTAISLLKQTCTVVSDDNVIIKSSGNNGYFVFQTPFFEKNIGVGNKGKSEYPLGKIYFLKKAKLNRIEPINNKQSIISKLMPQLYTEKSLLRKQTPSIMDFISCRDIFYNVSFNKDSRKFLQTISEPDS